MKKIVFLFIFLVATLLFYCPINLIAAPALSGKQMFDKGLVKTGGTEGAGFANLNDRDSMAVSQKIGLVIKILLSVVGVIFLILAIYGGFKWMKAQGNEQEVTAARDIIVNAVIGLAIVMAAYAITAFIGIAAGGTTVIGGTTPTP